MCLSLDLVIDDTGRSKNDSQLDAGGSDSLGRNGSHMQCLGLDRPRGSGRKKIRCQAFAVH